MFKTSRSLRRPRKLGAASAACLAAVLLSGCVSARTQTVAPGEVPLVMGPPVRTNVTPMEGVMACFADWVAASKKPPIVIGVGDVKDYTGKYSIEEGNAITQGGSLMVYSALGKLSGAVRIAERFDPSVAERELSYIDRRRLGNETLHNLGGPDAVPWIPYFGGTIRQSDYFIVGGITEVNYNIRSGGLEAGVSQIGAKGRQYSQQVAIDLRIVDTETLEVVKTISLAKQFTGYEVGANIFRFFGSDLFDINIGQRGQEPLQLGIRAALEEGVVRLISAVSDVDYRPCLNHGQGWSISETPAEDLRQRANPMTSAARPGFSQVVAINEVQDASTAMAGQAMQISFNFGAADLAGDAQGLIDQIAAMAKKGGVQVILVARDTENFDPGKRDALTDQRIAALVSALAARGVPEGAIRVSWRPDPADTSIHRDGPGLQEIAKLLVGG